MPRSGSRTPKILVNSVLAGLLTVSALAAAQIRPTSKTAAPVPSRGSASGTKEQGPFTNAGYSESSSLKPQEALRFVKNVAVDIELREGAKNYASEQDVGAIVESSLQAAGIVVRHNNEFPVLKLVINIPIFDVPVAATLVMTRVYVEQGVAVLADDGKKHTLALSSWDNTYEGYGIGRLNVVRQVNEGVNELTQAFIKDYKAVH